MPSMFMVFAGRMSRVCVHRCVQDPQQVVTRNRGGYAAARWLPIRQGLCVPLRAPPPAVVAPIVLGKSGVFPLLSLPRSETIIPPDCHAESHARSSWLGLRRLFATGTMLSLIKISFRGFPHPILVTVECPSLKSFLAGKSTDRL